MKRPTLRLSGVRLPASNRSRALTAGAVLVAVVLVLGIVKAWGGTDVEPLPDGEKQPEAVSFSGKPMWNERKLGMKRVSGVEFRGDIAIVAGDVDSGSRLAAVDARTGKPRWVVDGGSSLRGGDGTTAYRGFSHNAQYMRGVTGKPVVYGDGDGWTVLLQYAKGDRGRETEFGVAALSGEDGTVRWEQPIIRPRSGDQGDDDRDQRVRLLGADTRVALASVEGERGADPKTVAMDAATGRKLWESDAGWAYRFAGGVVLGETLGERAPSQVASLWGEQRKGTDVFALDVRTGQKRWDLSEAFDSSHLTAVAGDTAVVNVETKNPERPYPRRNAVVIDTATGRPGAKLRPLYGCEDDGRTLIACPGSDGLLVTIRSGSGGEAFTTMKPVFDEDTTPWPRLVRQDRIFIEGKSTQDAPVRRAVFDRAGNRLGPTPAGEITEVSEHAAAFRPEAAPDSENGLAVHAAAVGAKPAEPSGPGAPAVKAPRIDAAPLWTAGAGDAPPADQAVKDTGLQSLETIDLVGDAVVYTGRARERDDGEKLVVADAATGEERWSLRSGASLGDGAEAGFIRVPRIVDADEGRLVLVRYSGPGDTDGIAALALKDGAVRWKQRTSSGDAHTILEAADGKTFAVTVSNYRADRDETVVYSTATRKELWRKSGVEPEGVGGELVLTAEYDDDRPRNGVDVIAYGTSDGKRRWRLGDRYPEPKLLHDEGGKTVVVGTADGGAVLDRATGRELARTDAPLTRCDGDDDTLIVCHAGAAGDGPTDPGSRAVTIQTRGGATKVNDLLETGFLTRYGAIGNWFTAIRPATRSGAGRTPEQFLLLDGEGRQISKDLPGRPRGIAGGFAVVTPSKIAVGLGINGAPSFTVHRVQD
ncbi:PQQ-binding-like beta-propeller repeat protein [Actinomadura sp. 7K507]|uniref:outer membrane protein assembly factor BamB family protein n=1 Tax=Actinomadura sp. 7K507 TaxID=2530365 RepID=UPI0010537ACF|nr:PQQ-binding-like beta-propeller repeat protein [Actinomadura sp. 7K507]TDC88265.1 hypothetical protein E1285_18610 [Actinomadura sp. 7K507]